MKVVRRGRVVCRLSAWTEWGAGVNIGVFANGFWRYYGKRVLLGVGIAAIVGSMLAFCASESDVEGAEGLTKQIFSMIDEMFGSNALDKTENLLIINFTENSLTAGGYSLSHMTSAVRLMYKVMQNLGVIMLIIFFGVGLMEDISFNQVYAEKMVKKFIFFCIGIVLIGRSMDLVYGIGNIGSALIQRVVDTAGTSEDARIELMELKMAIYDMCNQDSGEGITSSVKDALHNIPAQLSFLVQLLIPWIVAKICNVIVSVVCWSRFLELTVMAILSPLMLSDMTMGHGMGSNAMRGVKNVIAISLSGTIIMLSLYLGHEIQVAVMGAYASGIGESNLMSAVWSEIAVSVVQVGMVMRSNALAKQALGMV